MDEMIESAYPAFKEKFDQLLRKVEEQKKGTGGSVKGEKGETTVPPDYAYERPRKSSGQGKKLSHKKKTRFTKGKK